MVQTRRQYNQWIDDRRGRRHTSQSESESSQSSQFSFNNSYAGSQDSTMFDDVPSGSHAMYGPNDHCKRHRKTDNDPKNQAVVGYRRRTPIRA